MPSYVSSSPAVKKGFLMLEDGQVFEGISFGADADVSGEVVFNTGMVGYPEGFTDPSYYGQILVMTYPLVGNYGVPAKNIEDGLLEIFESEKIQIRGLVITAYIENNTHWQSVMTLGEWLKKEGVPAICCVDTRTLTQIIREKGVLKGNLTHKNPRSTSGVFYDINQDNLVAEVSCKEPVVYGKGRTKILYFDCGAKLNQIRLLLKQDTTVIRVPWDYNPFSPSSWLVQDRNIGSEHAGDSGRARSSLARMTEPVDFDAIMISNGPGDPKMADKTIEVIKEAFKREIPILGVCLGNQILALAAGANTYKLKYGHRSQNQPVKDEETGRCYVTTQNHGFSVDTKTLPKGWKPWFINLNDGTNEGIRHTSKPWFSSQFHPESTPGPTDTEWIFEYFIDQIKNK